MSDLANPKYYQTDFCPQEIKDNKVFGIWMERNKISDDNFPSYLCITGGETVLSLQLDWLNWLVVFGKTRWKEGGRVASRGHHLAHTFLRPALKWLIGEQGPCQVTSESDSSVFMGKSMLAGLSGLKLRLHTKCDPKNEMPAFNPSSDGASSIFPCGNCGCYPLQAAPLPSLQ